MPKSNPRCCPSPCSVHAQGDRNYSGAAPEHGWPWLMVAVCKIIVEPRLQMQVTSGFFHGEISPHCLPPSLPPPVPLISRVDQDTIAPHKSSSRIPGLFLASQPISLAFLLGSPWTFVASVFFPGSALSSWKNLLLFTELNQNKTTSKLLWSGWDA